MDASQPSKTSHQQLVDSQTTTTTGSTSSTQNSVAQAERSSGSNIREMSAPTSTMSGPDSNSAQVPQTASVSSEPVVRQCTPSGDSGSVASRKGTSSPTTAATPAPNSNPPAVGNGEAQRISSRDLGIATGDQRASSVASGRPPKPQQPPLSKNPPPPRIGDSSTPSNQSGPQSPQKSQTQTHNASPQTALMTAESSSSSTTVSPTGQNSPLPESLASQPTSTTPLTSAPPTLQTTISPSATVSNVGAVGSAPIVQMQPGTTVVTKKKGRFNIIQHVPATAINAEVTVTTTPVITTTTTATTTVPLPTKENKSNTPADGAPPPPPVESAKPQESPEFSNTAKSSNTPPSTTNRPAPAPNPPLSKTPPVVKKKGRFVITSVSDPNTQMVPIALTTAPTVIATIPTDETGKVVAGRTDDQQAGLQQQQSQQLLYARPTQVMMTGVMPTQQVVYTTSPSAPSVNESAALASASSCITEENPGHPHAKAASDTMPQHKRSNSAGGSGTQNLSDQKPQSLSGSNSAKSMPAYRSKQNLSSLNGLHKVFYFLDQMKAEVVDADKTIKCLQADIKSLQNDMKFLKDKNKELEAKARDSERKLVEERNMRESVEGKFKTLKNKMRELKEEGILPVMNGNVDTKDAFGQEVENPTAKSIGESPSKWGGDSSEQQKIDQISPGQQAASEATPNNDKPCAEPSIENSNLSGNQSISYTTAETATNANSIKTNDSARISGQGSSTDPLLARTPPRDTPLVHHKKMNSNGPPPLPATGNRGVNRSTSAVVLDSSKQVPVVVPQSSKSYSGKTGQNLGKQAAAISKNLSTTINTSQPKTTPQDFDPLRPENATTNAPQDTTLNGPSATGPASDIGNALQQQVQHTEIQQLQQQQQTFQQTQFPVLMMDQQMAYPIVVEGADYMAMQTQPFLQMQPQQTLLSATPDVMGAQQQTILQMQPQQAMYGTPMNGMPVQNGSSYQDFPAQGMFLLQQPEISHQNPQMMTLQQPILQFQSNLTDPSQVPLVQQSPQMQVPQVQQNPQIDIPENKITSARQHLARNRSISVNDFDPLQQSGTHSVSHSAVAPANSTVDPFDELVNRK